jgi:drug/metabolite transporter (DMT)-like permease
MTFLRDLKDECHELVVLEYTYIFQCFWCCGIFLVWFGNSEQEVAIAHMFSYREIGKLVGFMCLTVLFSYSSQYIRTWSVFMCSPALIQPFNYLGVVFGIIVDVLVFDIHYNLTTFLGVMLTSIGLFSKFLLLFAKKTKSKES